MYNLYKYNSMIMYVLRLYLCLIYNIIKHPFKIVILFGIRDKRKERTKERKRKEKYSVGRI